MKKGKCIDKLLKHILRQNQCSNFKQTWHKATLGEGAGTRVCTNKDHLILIKR